MSTSLSARAMMLPPQELHRIALDLCYFSSETLSSLDYSIVCNIVYLPGAYSYRLMVYNGI